MSVLVGTGNIVWSGMYLVVSTIGLVVLVGLLNYFYINPYQITHWSYKGLLLLACMIASVVVFGGLTIGLWHLWEGRTSAEEEANDTEKIGLVQGNAPFMRKKSGQQHYINTIQYGQRPDFGGMIDPT